MLVRIETFFHRCVSDGQRQGKISSSLPAKELARHLLGVLLGIRVLARVRPDRRSSRGSYTLPLSFSIQTAAEPMARIERRGVSAGGSSPQASYV
jgi:TetR/AcrR family transcriptional repressor of nem operon